MNLVQYEVVIRGTRKLICHNGEFLADPTSDISKRMKEITGIRKKTDEHYKQMADVEWLGGLYLDEKNRPIVPFTSIKAMLCESARKHRLGKDVKSGLEVVDSPLIEHDGPKNATADDLIGLAKFRDKRLVSVNRAKVMRTRPCFPVWQLRFKVQIDPEIIKENDFAAILETGGRVTGMADYRPEYGKFEVVSCKKV